MNRLRWAPAASDDLQGIHDYLSEHRPAQARDTIRKLYAAAQSLKRFPTRGRIGQIRNTRELVTVPMPYIIVYGVDADTVNIYRIIHGAENWQQPATASRPPN